VDVGNARRVRYERRRLVLGAVQRPS